MSQLLLYSFYKNMLFSLVNIWFGFCSGFSAQSIYDAWAVALYNITFTGLPIVVHANDTDCFKLGHDTFSDRCRFGQIAPELLPSVHGQGCGKEPLNQDAEHFFIAPTLGNAVPVIFIQMT